MKETSPLLLILGVLLAPIGFSASADDEGYKAISVIALQQDPFIENKTHPMASVKLSVIYSDFGQVEDIRCSKTRRGTGAAECRLMDPDCDEADDSGVKYDVALQAEFNGFHLANNVASLEVKQCHFVPPESHEFVYKYPDITIYHISKQRTDSELFAFGGMQKFHRSNPEYQSVVAAYNTHALSQSADSMASNILASNNLVTLYANIANSYEAGSEEYRQYQDLAKSYEGYSALAANNQLWKIVNNTLPEETRPEFKVTPSITDYLNNVKTVENFKDTIISNCNECGGPKFQGNIEVIINLKQLNSISLKALTSAVANFDDV